MLENVTAEHFRALVGSLGVLQLSDGSRLPITISAIEEKPQARLADKQRMPFNVSLDALEPSDFVDGLCTLQIPESAQLEALFVSRVPPLGRDPNLAYYHISFN
ncbi:hypothetical protein [uncultured Pseudomonas sp.]|uniref:DUF6916 family protein n=1 Tax=uncultured Pseudomonas sp. TaxID=114707 RepID=UPI0025E06DC5|nr:hypothetical protein [uncultured Pseudomonas sp.]